MSRIAGSIGCDNSASIAESILKNMDYGNKENQVIVSDRRMAIGIMSTEGNGLLIVHSKHCDNLVAFDGQIYGLVGNDGFVTEAIPSSREEEIEYILSPTPGNSQADGMYALAIERDDDSIELRRDNFGIKPLFWRDLSAGQIFASEISAITRGLGVMHLRKGAIAEFLAFGRVLGNGTFYEGVYRVPPGGRVYLKGNKSYFRPPLRYATGMNRTQFRNALKGSILRCANSNQHVGLALSGGLDSSILAWQLNSMGFENLSTISIKISGSEDGIETLDELELPKDGVWSNWVHKSTSFSVRELPAMIDNCVHILGEPTRMTSVPLYIKLSKLARKRNIRILLLGEGADEIFAGYPSYLEWLKFYRYDRPTLEQIEFFTFPYIRRFWLAKLLGEKWVSWCIARLRDSYSSIICDDGLKSLLRVELSLSLEPLLLRTDNCLTRKGIVGRTPYLHAGIPNFASCLETHELISNNQTKLFLRRAYKSIVATKKNSLKRAFSVPSDELSNTLGDWIYTSIKSGYPNLEEVGFIRNGVEDLLSTALKGDREAISLCYSILNLLSWIKLQDNGGCEFGE